MLHHNRPDVQKRFQALVKRARLKATREEQAVLQRIKALPALPMPPRPQRLRDPRTWSRQAP